MGLGGPEDEKAAQDLQAQLRLRGYTVTEERREDRSFGDTVTVWRGNTSQLRLGRDRGQWFVEVAGPGGDWFSPIIWHGVLTSSRPSLNALSFREQVDVLLGDLGQIESATANVDETHAGALRALRSERAAARRKLAS